MEFLLIFSVHFIIVGSAVMLLSILISFFAKKVPVIVTILLCMLIGVIYANTFGLTHVTWLQAVFNGVVSAVAIAMVKVGMYAGEKAEKLDG